MSQIMKQAELMDLGDKKTNDSRVKNFSTMKHLSLLTSIKTKKSSSVVSPFLAQSQRSS